MNWMIYGANGYTGKLIAEEAKRRGLTPVLGGRREDAIRPLAESLNLEWRAFDLGTPKLDGIELVLHCAGPFSKTSRPMADAVISQGKHYLDITGEIEVFESLFRRQDEAKKSGSTVIPGVGFDVVPTDCLAALLKSKMSDATHLEMAMAGPAILSPGTVKSMIEGFQKGGWIREAGKLKSVPAFHTTKKIQFTRRSYNCSSIPWGDVCTAFYSTQIPNIIFYATAPKWSKYAKPFMPIAAMLTAIPVVQKSMQTMAGRFVKGPSQEHLHTAQMQIWGAVRNETGFQIEGRLEVPEGYWFTVLASLKAVEKVRAGTVSPGVFTPSMAFGKDFIKEFEGVTLHNV